MLMASPSQPFYHERTTEMVFRSQGTPPKSIRPIAFTWHDWKVVRSLDFIKFYKIKFVWLEKKPCSNPLYMASVGRRPVYCLLPREPLTTSGETMVKEDCFGGGSHMCGANFRSVFSCDYRYSSNANFRSGQPPASLTIGGC